MYDVCGVHMCVHTTLVVPNVHTKTYGEDAFSYVACTTYNKLPANITKSKPLSTLKSKLKTHLFEI